MTVGFLTVGDPAPSHTQLLRTARAWDRLDAQNNTPTLSKKGDGHGYHDFRPSALRCSAPAHKKAGPADMDVRRSCPREREKACRTVISGMCGGRTESPVLHQGTSSGVPRSPSLRSAAPAPYGRRRGCP